MNLTRKKLIFKSENEGLLDYNYQYELMKELYKAMSEVDKQKAENLHENGYRLNNDKKFKLFNYNFVINDMNTCENTPEGMKLKCGSEITLVVSGIDSIVNFIIKGFIKKQSFSLSNISFKFIDIQDDKSFRFNKIMLYNTRTPVVESIYDAESSRINYLNPYQQRYYEALGRNLLRKYELCYGKKYEGELYFDIENTLKIKKRLIRNIKNGYLIGYQNFEIYIEANPDMQKIAYYLGLGQNNSIGMGNLSYVTGRRM